MNRTSTIRAGFTLIELMAVVLILAILAGVALPRFFDYQDQARVAACKGTLGGVRAGIANWYANEAIRGATAAYPTLADLTKVGEVMQEAIPDNPYTVTADVFDADNVELALKAESDSRAEVAAGGGGWAYFDGGGTDPAVFYANTNTISENSF